jgi:hypothetical protein
METIEPVSVREREFRRETVWRSQRLGGLFRHTTGVRATEPRYPTSAPAKPRKVKDYSEHARKPELRRTAWWCS